MLGPPDLLAEMEDLASKEMGKGNLPQSDGGPSIEGKSSREGKGILFYGFVRFLRRKVLHFGERRLHIYYYIGNSFLSGPPVLQAASGPGGGVQDSRGAGGGIAPAGVLPHRVRENISADGAAVPQAVHTSAHAVEVVTGTGTSAAGAEVLTVVTTSTAGAEV